jgi:hypothetical protein
MSEKKWYLYWNVQVMVLPMDKIRQSVWETDKTLCLAGVKATFVCTQGLDFLTAVCIKIDVFRYVMPCGIFCLEGVGSRVTQEVDNLLPNYMTSHPERRRS